MYYVESLNLIAASQAVQFIPPEEQLLAMAEAMQQYQPSEAEVLRAAQMSHNSIVEEENK